MFDRKSTCGYLTGMDDERQESWFYTREGEKCGPVSFSDLRIKAGEGTLNPRLDLVWTQGMDVWKPAGELDDLFERRAAPGPAEILAPAANPYQSPQGELVAGPMGQDGVWPGARRRSYLIATLIFPILWGLAVGAGEGFLTPQLGAEVMKYVVPALNLVSSLVAIYFILMRLVNLGMSRWWILGSLVPLLNVWVGYRCFACPGGYAFHKKLDGAGIFLAIVYWLMLAVIIAVIAALILLFLGVIGTPEFKDQLREMLEAAAAPKA